jgi:two-component system sensor histidine kinase DctS
VGGARTDPATPLAEQALRSEYAFRKAMEDSLMVGMRARDLDGRVTYVNPAFLQMVGFSAEELIGREPPMPYWAPEEMETDLLLHNKVLEGKAPHEGFEIRLMRKDGSRFDALIYEAPLIDADGRQTGWMGSIIDVTERKHAEELARQQQEKLQVTARLVTMGEMASTLAHELNQPLAAITSYNAGCLNKLESGNFTAVQLKEALGKLACRRSAPATSSAACTTSCARASPSSLPAISPRSSMTASASSKAPPRAAACVSSARSRACARNCWPTR